MADCRADQAEDENSEKRELPRPTQSQQRANVGRVSHRLAVCALHLWGGNGAVKQPAKLRGVPGSRCCDDGGVAEQPKARRLPVTGWGNKPELLMRLHSRSNYARLLSLPSHHAVPAARLERSSEVHGCVPATR